MVRLRVAVVRGRSDPSCHDAASSRRPGVRRRVRTMCAHRYQDGPDNDPKYWPLDYPPLSGYQVWVHRASLCAWLTDTGTHTLV
jgi:alpha-1,3-glucosyltransferase